MTKSDAENKGYKQDYSTSFCPSDREEALAAAAAKRAEGYRALVVKLPASRVISRGRGMKWSGGGWSVMYKEK